MNYIDIAIALLLVWGVARGGYRGLVLEITGLLAIALAVYGAVYTTFLQDFFTQDLHWESPYTVIVAKGITFLVIFIGIMLLGKLLTRVLKLVFLGWLNRVLGAVFGFLKMFLLMAFAINYLSDFNEKAQVVDQETINQSVLLDTFKETQDIIFPYIDKAKKKAKDLI